MKILIQNLSNNITKVRSLKNLFTYHKSLKYKIKHDNFQKYNE